MIPLIGRTEQAKNYPHVDTSWLKIHLYSYSYSVRRTVLVLGRSERFEYDIEYRFTEYEYG